MKKSIYQCSPTPQSGVWYLQFNIYLFLLKIYRNGLNKASLENGCVYNGQVRNMRCEKTQLLLLL